MDTICTEILKKGELQIAEKERHQKFEELHKDIATTIVDKCINPETKKPYTVTMIEKAMADLHVSLNPNRSAKQQVRFKKNEKILIHDCIIYKLRIAIYSVDI